MGNDVIIHKRIIVIALAVVLSITGFLTVMNGTANGAGINVTPYADISNNTTTSHNILYLGEVTSPVLSSLNYYGSLGNYYFSSMLYVPFAAYEFPPHPYLEMELGQGYTSNANYTVFNLTLKKNLYWDNGQPLTSKDLWLTLMLSWQSGYFINVTSIRIINSTTVQVTTDLSQPNFVPYWVTDTNSYIIPYSVYIHQDPTVNITNTSPSSQFYNITTLLHFTNLNNIVADGPFVITNYTQGENPIIFKANPYYFKGKPKMSEVVVRIFESVSSEAAAMRAGEIDGMWDMGSYNAVVKPNFMSIPNAKVYMLEPGPYMSVDFDMGVWPFNTTQFRMALAYLTNRTALDNEVNIDNGTMVGYNWLTNSLDESIGVNPSSVNNYPFNVAKANALLSQIGIVYNNATGEYMYNNPNLPDYGKQVSFTIVTTQLGFGDLDTAIELINEWDSEGFSVSEQTLSVSPFYSEIDLTDSWDVAVQINPSGYYPNALLNVQYAPVSLLDNSTLYSWNSSFGMPNYNVSIMRSLTNQSLEYPLGSNQSNYYAAELSSYLDSVVVQIPLWDDNNWELLSTNYYWGNQTNSTGIFNGQALVQEQFWYGALYNVHYIGPSTTYTSSSSILYYIIGGVIAAVVVIGVGIYAWTRKRRVKEERKEDNSNNKK